MCFVHITQALDKYIRPIQSNLSAATDNIKYKAGTVEESKKGSEDMGEGVVKKLEKCPLKIFKLAIAQVSDESVTSVLRKLRGAIDNRKIKEGTDEEISKHIYSYNIYILESKHKALKSIPYCFDISEMKTFCLVYYQYTKPSGIVCDR